MKKIVFLSIFIALSFFASAQFIYGPRVGIGSSSADAGTGASGSGIGVVAGGFLTADIFDKVGLQFEFLFNIKSASVDIGNKGKSSVTYQTMDFPLYLRFPLRCFYKKHYT